MVMENTFIYLFDSVRKHNIVKNKSVNTNIKYFEYTNYGFVKQRMRPYRIKHKIYNVQLEPEKYFHSLLMLFKPWQQETDILGTHNIFFGAFMRHN